MLEEYIVVDLEMTGLRPRYDKILEIGAVHVKNGQIMEQYQTLVDPGILIPLEVQQLTGITDDMAKSGVSIEQAMTTFLDFAGELPLVGHNILYDYSFLKHNAVNQKKKLDNPVVDTLKLARKFLPAEQKKTLEALVEHFGIKTDAKHRALSDAIATARVLEILRFSYEEQEKDAFLPFFMQIKVKKQSPITIRQKKYLIELAKYHKIELKYDLDLMTRSEASRLTDQILAKYGRMPK